MPQLSLLISEGIPRPSESLNYSAVLRSHYILNFLMFPISSVTHSAKCKRPEFKKGQYDKKNEVYS